MDQAFARVDAAKTNALIHLMRERLDQTPKRILVVGCGSGREAGILARGFRAETIGIDIGTEFAFRHEEAKPAILRIMDARALEFDDGTFDLVYSFHALEHIPDFSRALAEMSRVLRPGGMFCIGTPNRARLVGYVGSSVPLRTKLLWNFIDLSKRLKGRWSNEQGAHAGFYASDLRNHCLAHLGEAKEITSEYYIYLYRRRRALIQWLAKTSLRYRFFPCVYFIGHKPTNGTRGQHRRHPAERPALAHSGGLAYAAGEPRAYRGVDEGRTSC